MNDVVTIQLRRADVLMILDALESRAASYENTAAYAIDPESAASGMIVEEHRDAEEADSIARDFRSIISTIEDQIA